MATEFFESTGQRGLLGLSASCPDRETVRKLHKVSEKPFLILEFWTPGVVSKGPPPNGKYTGNRRSGLAREPAAHAGV